MFLAVNTDILQSTGSPDPWLKMISEAGFTHLHWCHQWCTDYLYSAYELRHYAARLKEFGLKLLDIHGSAGQEKCWFSLEEYQRKSGVELVENRIRMFVELEGTGSLMMHVPYQRFNMPPDKKILMEQQFVALKHSLDELMPVLEKYGVRIAVENMPSDTFEEIAALMREYPPERLGITYDSGHGNIAEGRGLDLLEPLKDRLQALHLNDNDGSGDQHQPPFMGTVDWERMAKIIAESSYTDRPMSFEIGMRCTPGFEPELKGNQKPERVKAFLADAYARCEKVSKLVDSHRIRNQRS